MTIDPQLPVSFTPPPSPPEVVHAVVEHPATGKPYTAQFIGERENEGQREYFCLNCNEYVASKSASVFAHLGWCRQPAGARKGRNARQHVRQQASAYHGVIKLLERALEELKKIDANSEIVEWQTRAQAAERKLDALRSALAPE